MAVSNWEACSSSDPSNYASGLDKLLHSVSFPPICCVQNCSSTDHRTDVSNYYESICESIRSAMIRFIPSKKVNVGNYSMAGGNDLVADKHEAARQAFREWVSAGKPRTGYICELMKRARAHFKLAMRFCKNNDEQLRNDAMAKNYLTNQSKFWKNVKNVSNNSITNKCNTVNGASGDAYIAEMWLASFEKLYNMHSNDSLVESLYHYETETRHIISNDDLCNVIQQLKCHKCCGPDGIPAEAIKYSGHLLSVHLTLLFNMCLCHSFVPDELINTTVVPLLKNKSGDITDVNNHRAIALSNCLSKILESLMLNCLQASDLCDDFHQFGFKKSHSTSLSCGVLKNVVDYYRTNDSYVFATFLDLSKTFHSVNHLFLFKSLTASKCHSNLIKLLAYWYAHQQLNVRWKKVVTSSFLMRNGTRQGSVLSPYLFSICMRSLSVNVVDSGLGCHISGNQWRIHGGGDRGDRPP